jgi:hypothetical protein
MSLDKFQSRGISCAIAAWVAALTIAASLAVRSSAAQGSISVQPAAKRALANGPSTTP